MSVSVDCCSEVPTLVCYFPTWLLRPYLFILLNYIFPPQVILDAHKRIFVLHFWDMTAFDWEHMWGYEWVWFGQKSVSCCLSCVIVCLWRGLLAQLACTLTSRRQGIVLWDWMIVSRINWKFSYQNSGLNSSNVLFHCALTNVKIMYVEKAIHSFCSAWSEDNNKPTSKALELRYPCPCHILELFQRDPAVLLGHMGYVISLGLPSGLLLVRCASDNFTGKHPRGIIMRCSNHLN